MPGAEQAPRSFDAALQHVATDAALGDVEREDFGDWLLGAELWPDDERLGEWRSSAAYERTKSDRIAACCTCFSRPDGGQRTWTMPYGEVKQRVEDGLSSLPGESLASWDARVRADREARGVALGDYFDNPAAYTWCGIERTCTCMYDGSGMESDAPGQTCDHYDATVLEPRADDWRPSGGDWVPEGWGDALAFAVSDDEEEPATPSPPPPPPPPPPSAAPPELPDGLHPPGEPMSMPLAVFKAMLQEMTTEQLRAREDAIMVCQNAWWAAPTWMRPPPGVSYKDWKPHRPPRPDHLWEERSHIYEEMLERCRCKSCGFYGCQCRQQPQPPTQRESKREAWLASLPPGERAHHEAIAPRKIYDAAGRVLLIEELDPEGEFPFYYFPGDSGRALARHLGTRDSFYAWLDASASTHEDCAPTVPSPQLPDPPKRGDFPRGRSAEGKAGRDLFHRERKKWFKRATRSHDHPDGIELAGSLAEQNTQYDIVARRFRTYSDGRPT